MNWPSWISRYKKASPSSLEFRHFKIFWFPRFRSGPVYSSPSDSTFSWTRAFIFSESVHIYPQIKKAHAMAHPKTVAVLKASITNPCLYSIPACERCLRVAQTICRALPPQISHSVLRFVKRESGLCQPDNPMSWPVIEAGRLPASLSNTVFQHSRSYF